MERVNNFVATLFVSMILIGLMGWGFWVSYTQMIDQRDQAKCMDLIESRTALWAMDQPACKGWTVDKSRGYNRLFRVVSK